MIVAATVSGRGTVRMLLCVFGGRRVGGWPGSACSCVDTRSSDDLEVDLADA